MKYDFSAAIPSLLGGELKESAIPDAASLTFKTAAINSLLGRPSKEGFDANAKLFDLASQINDNPTAVEIKSEQVTLLKRAIGESYGPNVCGPFERLLEGGPK